MDYFQKHALYPPLIKDFPSKELGIIVVIPCFDEPNLMLSLQSLLHCELPKSDVEVIVIINSGETDEDKVTKQNEFAYRESVQFSTNHSHQQLQFHVFNFQFPAKHAGVGMARKVGMDEAARRFEALNTNGVIVCFDADSQCDSNYLIEIEKAFETHPLAPGASICFEHPTAGKDFSNEIYEAIIQYELYLRYYCNGLRWAGHPYAFQTIGSSMAVKSKVYQAQGGMNKRKAGEDFYFLEKIIPLGNFIEINTTMVIPSPRPSHRVPFGTGKAVSQWLENHSNLTYHPLIFKDLKALFQSIDGLYRSENIRQVYDNFPESFQRFMAFEAFENSIAEILKNTKSFSSFQVRFFKWFNLFQVLKFVHFCEGTMYPQVPIVEAVVDLFSCNKLYSKDREMVSVLIDLRSLDKNYAAKPF